MTRPPRRLSANLVLFDLGSLAKSIGTGATFPLTLLLFSRLLDTSFTNVGLVLTVSALVVLPLLPLAGDLADRLGGRLGSVGALVCRAGVFAALLLWPSFPAFVVGSILMALLARAEMSSSRLLAIEASSPAEVPRWLAHGRAAFNTGYGLGAMAAAFAITLSPAAVLSAAWGSVGTGLLAGICFLAIRTVRGIAKTSSAESDGAPAARPGRLYLNLVVIGAVATAAGLLLESMITPFVLRHTAAPSWLPGALLALNTAMLAVLFVVGQKRLSELRQSGGLAVSMGLIAVGLAMLPVSAMFGSVWATAALTLGMVIYSFGELISTQTTGVLLTVLPPPGRRGRFLGMGEMVNGGVAAPVPLLAGALVDRDALWVWVVIFAVIAAAGVLAASRALRPFDRSVAEITSAGRHVLAP